MDDDDDITVLLLLAHDDAHLSSSLQVGGVTPQHNASDAAKSTKLRATWSLLLLLDDDDDDDDDDASRKNSLRRYGCTSFPSAKRDFNLLASSSSCDGLEEDWSIDTLLSGSTYCSPTIVSCIQ